MLAIPWIAALIGGLVSAASTFVGRALLGLGVSLLTYKGFEKLLSGLLEDVIKGVKGAPVEVLQIMGLLEIDKCIGIIFSAYMAKVAMVGMKKWVTK